MPRRIWIVGGSSGIGFELVKRWLEAGHRVIVSARHAKTSDRLSNLKAVHGAHLRCIDLDVTDNASVSFAVREAWAQFDGIDLWLYNAGAYEPMRAEAWNLSHFENMVQTNYLGAVRLMTQLLPKFERQQYGTWVFNCSLSGYFGLPYGGGYSAPKAALMNLAESIQPEMMARNIEIRTINHGFVKTRLTAKNDFEMPELMTPEDAAAAIDAALEKPYRFESHFPFRLSMFLRILRLLPYSVSLKMTRKMLR